MPVLVPVRQILVVGSDRCLAGETRVGEQLLVALLAVRLIVAQNVSLTDEARRTATAAELTATPVLLQRLREVCGEEHLMLA